jgi:hypothetical protein
LEASKIVVRYLSGKVIKGHTQNFFPNKPSFHLTPLEGENIKGPIEVSLDQLKGIFFVRDFIGDKTFKESNQPAPGEKPQGRLIEVTCKDGEVMVGTTSGYDPKRAGFFLFPVNTRGNNTKAFIISSAVGKTRFL